MKITLTIPNISTNRLYTYNRHTGRRILTDRARATKEAWAWEAKDQYKDEPLAGSVHAEVALYFADRRRRDLDNIKALIDAMTSILWTDDSCITDLYIKKRVDPEKPRIEIYATSYQETN